MLSTKVGDGLGKRLVRSLIEVKNFNYLSCRQITSIDLFNDARACYEWIYNYVIKTGTWPTCKMVEETISCILPDEPEDIEYIAELVRKRSLSLSLEIDLKKAIEF